MYATNFLKAQGDYAPDGGKIDWAGIKTTTNFPNTDFKLFAIQTKRRDMEVGSAIIGGSSDSNTSKLRIYIML